jgi:hypothetical protein
LKPERSDVHAGEPDGIVVGRGGGFPLRIKRRLAEFVRSNI